MARRLPRNNHKDTQNNCDRKKNIRDKVLSVIIACEDESSAPTYFKMIVKRLKDNKLITQDSLVIADHKHNTPMGVLSDLINHKKNGKSYRDFEHTDMVVLVGSNTAWCHPVLYQRIMKAKEDRKSVV